METKKNEAKKINLATIEAEMVDGTKVTGKTAGLHVVLGGHLYNSAETPEEADLGRAVFKGDKDLELTESQIEKIRAAMKELKIAWPFRKVFNDIYPQKI